MSDEQFVRSGYARRYWLDNAANAANDQAFYERVFALNQKYPLTQTDILLSLMFGQDVRDEVWRLYVAPRQNLGTFEVKDATFETTIALPKLQKIGSFVIFATSDCAVDVLAEPTIVKGEPDGSGLQAVTALRNGYREVLHILALYEDVTVSKFRISAVRNMNAAPSQLHNGKCFVSLQTIEGRVHTMTEEALTKNMTAAFDAMTKITLPAAEKRVADPVLQNLFDLRILLGQFNLLENNIDRLN
jgi:hypothetical protein